MPLIRILNLFSGAERPEPERELRFVLNKEAIFIVFRLIAIAALNARPEPIAYLFHRGQVPFGKR